jgi:ATP-dependent helicase/nuclease subunit A
MPTRDGGGELGDFQTLIASAGTGKTFDLVERMQRALEGGLEPHRLLATTFTVRAAAELAGRIRSRLTERGRPDLAAALLAARIDTVNGVSGALVGEYALELGRSPGAEVIAEERLRALFALATGAVLGHHAPRIRPFAERFEIPERSWSARGSTRVGWVELVHEIVDRARANGIGERDLPRSAAHSRAGLQALLPDLRGEDGDALDAALVRELRMARDSFANSAPTTDEGRKLAVAITNALDEAAMQEVVSWPTWMRIAKAKVGKRDRERVARLQNAAAAHARHPRLITDLTGYVDAIFAAAADAMRAFDRFKAERGLVDFVDQEMLALAILRDPTLRERLSESIGAVFVDESQDSSPIQLAIFAALAEIAPINVWVGDPKQSIYAFRSADPHLTETAARQMTNAAGRAPAYLDRSYRSRPEICTFVNAVFVPAFTALGAEPNAVAFASWQRAPRDDAPLALGIIRDPEARKRDEEAAAIAKAIAGMLRRPDAWPIEERSGAVRSLRGGDVAVLCRTNVTVGRITAALRRAGVRTQAELPGLMIRPECELLHALLRCVADPTDGVAAAEVARFVAGPTDWLDAAFAEGDGRRWDPVVPFAADLQALRTRAIDATPTEMLDEILHLPGVLEVIDGWGDAAARRENLEALRALARAYGEEERASGRAVTLTGLAAYLGDAEAAASPASRHPDAVHVLTFHAAKGLEWPAVILTDLHQEPKERLFGITPEALTQPDWRDPLRDRVIRYWPWPYGALRGEAPLATAAVASDPGRAAIRLEREEALRLLYVAFTRARDYLIFALGARGNHAALDVICDADDARIVTLGDDFVDVAGVRYPAQLLGNDDPPRPAAVDAVTFRAPRAARIAHPPRSIRPSDVASVHAPSKVEAITLGAPLPLPERFDMRALGEALHGLFAIDDPTASDAVRSATAEAMLTRWNVTAFGVDAALTASLRLHRFLQGRYPQGAARHEWPLHVESDGRITTGRTDLVIDLQDGFVLIDHKSFPGDITEDARLRAFAGQTTLYARSLTTVLGKPCLAVWAHQPVAGRITRVEVGG